MQYVDRSILREVYRKREPWVHKGKFGRLALICGSEMHTGSACFVGMAAYRAGTDLVYVIAPERAADVAANYSPVLITKPLEGIRLEEKHEDIVLDTIKKVKATAVVIGPGLWRDNETLNAITDLIAQIDLPMVIDADAIRAVARHKVAIKFKKCVITPHADEFRDLTHNVVDENLYDRTKIVKKEAAKLESVVLLKGHIDIISDGKKIMLNKTGTPFMTKGGLGDTLAGICGSYLARGVGIFTAACAAAYVNGKVGEIISKKYGESLLPTDLIEHIYEVIKTYSK